MKIFIDINHPAHVHYFKNFIKIMEEKGHNIFVSARDRDVTFELLDNYKIKFFNRGKGGRGRLGKMIYLFWANIQLLYKALSFKPDLFVSFVSPYAAQVSFILRKPHVALNDTEHADKNHKIFTYPFTSHILTPKAYYNDLGTKHIRFNNIIESLYLSKKYFTPDENILKKMRILKSEKFVVLRFVSWDAHHDFGEFGISKKNKIEIIKILITNGYRVFISSESKLDKEFEEYRLCLSADDMHHVLYYASLFIGESGTMASESAFLGVPVIYINSLPLMGYLKLERDYSLLKHFSSSKGITNYLIELLKDENFKDNASLNSKLMKKDFINSTDFLVWFVENYPDSCETITENSKFQSEFNE